MSDAENETVHVDEAENVNASQDATEAEKPDDDDASDEGTDASE